VLATAEYRGGTQVLGVAEGGLFIWPSRLIGGRHVGFSTVGVRLRATATVVVVTKGLMGKAAGMSYNAQWKQQLIQHGTSTKFVYHKENVINKPSTRNPGQLQRRQWPAFPPGQTSVGRKRDTLQAEHPRPHRCKRQHDQGTGAHQPGRCHASKNQGRRRFAAGRPGRSIIWHAGVVPAKGGRQATEGGVQLPNPNL